MIGLPFARDLLADTGSIFVQIGDENVHRVRALMDEVFGETNFVGHVIFNKTTGFSGSFLSQVADSILWYGKSLPQLKYRELWRKKVAGEEVGDKVPSVGLYRSCFPPSLFADAPCDVS